jgi:hypothetical protein
MIKEKEVVFAVEVNTKSEDVSIGFIAIPQTNTAEEKVKVLTRAVQNGTYVNWSGSNRRKFAQKALAKGHTIEFRIGVAPFNGQSKAGKGFTMNQ